MATDTEIRRFTAYRLRGEDRARRDRNVEPCPPETREAIEEALRHFGLM